MSKMSPTFKEQIFPDFRDTFLKKINIFTFQILNYLAVHQKAIAAKDPSGTRAFDLPLRRPTPWLLGQWDGIACIEQTLDDSDHVHVTNIKYVYKGCTKNKYLLAQTSCTCRYVKDSRWSSVICFEIGCHRMGCIYRSCISRRI